MRRVVITGLGIVSCIGNNQSEVLDSLLNTKSGIVFSEDHKKYNFRSQVVGTIKNLNISDHIEKIPINLRADSQFRGLPSIHLIIIQSYFWKY